MKIAICVPHYGDVKARFFQSVANVVSATMAARINFKGAMVQPDIRTMIMGSTDVGANRHVLVNDARKWGADYILFVDSDMTFPANALLKLLAANKLVVGCNYAFRDGRGGMAARNAGNGEWERYSDGSGIERAAFMGLGLCLLNTRIFNDLAAPWFRTTLTADGEVEEGEDGYFFALCHNAGIPIFVHNDLSRDVGHLAEREIKLGGADVDTARASAGAQ